MNKKLREAKDADLHVIDEEFLNELEKNTSDKIDIESFLLKHNIATWGSDLKKRMTVSIANFESNGNERQFKSSGDGKLKLKVKGGAAVDPDSGLEDEAHVLIESGTNEPFSCVLGMVDVMRGTNSYYKLQLLESDRKTKWYVFRAWGRVGTSVGANKLTEFSRKDDAVVDFHEVYLDKTGNSWDERKENRKNANKFYPLEMDYGDEVSLKSRSILFDYF